MPKKSDELESAQPRDEKDETVKAPVTEPAPKTVADEADEAKQAKAKTTPAAETAAKSGNDSGSRPAVDMKQLAIRIGAVTVAAVVVLLVVFGVLIYTVKSENPVVKAVSAVVPYPVERVNGRFVSYHDYLFEVDANKRAYQNNAKLNNQPAPDFNSADGKKLVTQIKQHAMDKLKSDAVVAQLAQQKKVKVTNKEVTDLVNQLYTRYGGKDTLLKTLNQIYGWNLGDLNGVVRKQLLAQKVQDKVTADPALDAQAKATAQDVLNKVKAGGDFAALAKQYSQASDASSGGDLGTVAKGQLPDDEQKAIDALQPGQVSDLVKTQYGYEIIKVTDKTADGAKASHILIQTINFDDYFGQQLNKAKVSVYFKP